MHWDWEEIDENRSGSSGDISKLFKNEELKSPGFLEEHAPRPDATIMAREVIQNSWDAAKDLRAQLNQDVPFEIEFEFRELNGSERAATIQRLDLEHLAEQADGKDWRELGLPSDSILKQIGSSPLRVLLIRERGSSGMYGPWKRSRSKMWLALVSVGYTKKALGSGGSYGYGKAGLIRGSATRTVVAYSCFRERQDDPRVTRRLLGMTYWGPFDDRTGFARLGHRVEAGVRPLEGESADDFALELGLDRRDPSAPRDLGTTFILVDPTVRPQELVRAVERNWWPALIEDDDFGVSVIDYEGQRHRPEPRNSPELGAFIRGYDLATGATPDDGAHEKEVTFQPVDGLQIGSLGLVGDPEGWSYPGDDGVDHRSLVALIRGPKMVVEYAEAGYSKPYVRGAFKAHEDVDDLLRQTEPSGHDVWQVAIGDDSTDPRAPEIAKAVYKRVSSNLNSFRAELKPPIPDRRDIRLPELERLFRTLISDDGTKREPPPPGEPRDVGIAVLDQRPEVAPQNPDLIRLRARVAYQLTDHHEADEADVWLQVRYQFLEDQRAGEDVPLTVSAPDGFIEDGGRITGRIGRDPVEVGIVSAAYDPDWSGRLTVAAGVLPEEPPE